MSCGRLSALSFTAVGRDRLSGKTSTTWHPCIFNISDTGSNSCAHRLSTSRDAHSRTCNSLFGWTRVKPDLRNCCVASCRGRCAKDVTGSRSVFALLSLPPGRNLFSKPRDWLLTAWAAFLRCLSNLAEDFELWGWRSELWGWRSDKSLFYVCFKTQKENCPEISDLLRIHFSTY